MQAAAGRFEVHHYSLDMQHDPSQHGILLPQLHYLYVIHASDLKIQLVHYLSSIVTVYVVMLLTLAILFVGSGTPIWTKSVREVISTAPAPASDARLPDDAPGYKQIA